MGNSLSDEHSKLEPPDPISNSEVKRLSADGSVGFPHVRVGHRQAFTRKRPSASHRGVFFCKKNIVKWPSINPPHGTDSMTDASTAWHHSLQTLRLNRRMAVVDWPSDVIAPEQFGLKKEGASILVPETVRFYDEAYLIDQLNRIDVSASLRLFDAVDSTNTAMMKEAQAGSVGGQIYLAEFQTAGRGRRGRHWIGDFGRNVAMTMGFSFQRQLSDLGGLSCVVGLALIQVLEILGVKAQLKWPNDVWVNDKKLAGILVELVRTARETSAIVGIGMNVHLIPEQLELIDQEVIDLRSLDVAISREDLVVAIYDNLVMNVRLFAQEGFVRFVPAFNAVHRLHDVQAVLTSGNSTQEGRVRGVDHDGALLFEENGAVYRIAGGEVSLRPSNFGKT